MSNAENENPFASPDYIASPAEQRPSDRREFVDLDTARVKKLWERSENIGTIGFLCLIGGVLIFLVGAAGSMSPLELLVLGTIATVLIVGGIGMFSRSNWGRLFGYILCILMTISILAISELVCFSIMFFLMGIPGLFALSEEKLFGPERYRSKDLRTEYRFRRKFKIN